MGPRTVKADDLNDDRVFRERMPAVTAASLALQAVVGIAPGTRLFGSHVIRIWEMPEPPSAATSSQDKLGPPLARSDCEGDDNEEDASVTSGDSQILSELICHLPIEEDVMMAEDEAKPPLELYEDFGIRKAAMNGSFTFEPKCDAQNEEVMSVEDPAAMKTLQESPQMQTTQALWHDVNRQAAAADPLEPVREAASPPPDWHQSQRSSNSKREPGYWSAKLSHDIHHWLKHPETKSSQVYLSHLRAQRIPQDEAYSIFVDNSAGDYAKVKVTRMTLPGSAQQALAPPQSLEWLVIEVRYSDVEDADSDSEDLPLEHYKKPYWLLAFPKEAVTSLKTNCKEQQGILRPQSNTVLEPLHVLTMQLGKTDRAPLVHGRGVDKRFADDFVKACVEGKAVIELCSDVPVSVFET